MRKLAKLLKNKKGFTLVEAIAVVAIMGILATVIGGLVTAGTTAYMRQKENAAAKDLGTIVQNEIKRAARSSIEVYLQDGELPRDTNMITIGDTQTTYQMKNAPTDGVFLTPKCCRWAIVNLCLHLCLQKRRKIPCDKFLRR